MSVKIEWSDTREMLVKLADYQDKVKQAVLEVVKYFEPLLENYAKENASWTDRSGNARQDLHAFSVELANNIIVLYLSHGVTIDYAKYLEMANAGKYQIIMPTIQAHQEAIHNMLEGIFKK